MSDISGNSIGEVLPRVDRMNLLPPPPYSPEGFNGIPVFPRGKGTETGPPCPDESPDDEEGDSGKASDTRPPVPTP